ncbi:MAG: hypothetical protein LBR90_03020 [Elusimicrobiota bacterium]|jgi:hypothetical protein|nr:hypothetical protein [Elusimicrobiota bacterium]
MRKFFLTTLCLLAAAALYAQGADDMQHFSAFNGLRVQNINVTATRINPAIVKAKFLMREGDTFNYQNFDDARKALHDMRIFKSVRADAQINAQNNLDININCEDGHFLLPLPVIMSSGGSTAAALILMEANLFKLGELATLTGAYGKAGYLAALGLHLGDNSYSAMFLNQDYTQKIYQGGAYNRAGLFGGKDKDAGRAIANQYDVKETAAGLSYGRSLGERLSLRFGYAYQDIEYKAAAAAAPPADAGAHHRLQASVSAYRNIKPGKGVAGAFGSIFGLGTSDKEHRLASLPYIRPGYFASLDYSAGGGYTGADYDISILSAALIGSLELKTRHTFYVAANAAQTFEGGFSDGVSTKKLLAGKGRYSTQYIGQKGFGGGLFAALFVLKNNTAVAVFEPFVESSWLFDGAARCNQAGAGASLYVTFWRFQLPLGVNFTKDITNGENTLSFVFGAGF